MSKVAQVHAVAMQGLDGSLLSIEGDAQAGLPRFTIVGLPDTALAESKNRVRSALINSGLPFPTTAITINLSPASLPKQGSGFDLAVAMVLLSMQAAVRLPPGWAFLGELGLDGSIRPTTGVLATVRAAALLGVRRMVVPKANLEEAELVPGIEVTAAAHLRNLAITLGFDGQIDEALDDIQVPIARAHATDVDLELAEVVGQDIAVEGLIAAAAGGHHLMMVGPAGAGKTMLASRMRAILPDLDARTALEVSALQSLTQVDPVVKLALRPPWQAPHHSATAVSIIGGGSGRVRPGAASLASGGVLFLDEAPEFHRTALDALRQCLESRSVTVHRARQIATFPAAFQLILAANPCPCGMDGVVGANCTCKPALRRGYLQRLSGPLLDRIDISLRVPMAKARIGTLTEYTTAKVRAQVENARKAGAQRLAPLGFRLNVEVPGQILHRQLRLSNSVMAPLQRALNRQASSLRGVNKVLRVAWTLADLAGRTSPASEDIDGAMYYRGLAVAQ